MGDHIGEYYRGLLRGILGVWTIAELLMKGCGEHSGIGYSS